MTEVRYLRLDEPGQLTLATAELPPLPADQVLLEARRSLISTGSELRRYRRYEGYTAFTYPVTDLGYSMVGTVTAVGDAVRGPAVGDRYVAVQRHATAVQTPADIDGVRTAVRVPDGVSDEEATFGPLLRSSLNWLRNYAIEPDQTVVIVGQGLVGALQMQAARLHTPRRLIVTDALPLRLDLARQLGADEAINAAEGDPVAAVRELTGGRGADVVVETVGGASVDSFVQALRMCRTGGRVVAVGMHTAPVPIPPHTLHGITVVGSQVGYSLAAGIFRRGLELVADGHFRVAPLVTHRFAFTAAADAYDLLDRRPAEALGVILEW